MQNDKQKIDKGIVGHINHRIFGVLSILLVLASSFIPYNNHVSYTEITYDKSIKTISFTLEVFTPDLEKAIQLEFTAHDFVLGKDSISNSLEKFIQAYINQKTTIIIDGIVLKQAVFKPSTSQANRTIIQYSFTDIPPISSLSIYSEILTSVFTDQQNIVELISNESREKALLTNSKLNHTWILKN